MRALFRLRPPRRFAWLLWLVLAIPFAQGVAARHVLAHAAGDAVAARSDKQALHQAACDLCLAAAAVGSGAPAAGPPPPLPAAGDHEPPVAAASGGPLLLPVRPYQSRAPPLALR